ncbi:hypothetical protein QBC44DRAFT_276214 [Cladorrhinum sp. PSN332]|nr:hypothetical protein QBC44DRAFT_276214 [Cladorrhinum sp. PSN332]
MRVGELAVRALLGGVALDRLGDAIPEESFNSSSLIVARQSCEIGTTRCGTGCMGVGRVCCASRDSSCDPGYYCMATSGCCPIGSTCGGVVGSCDPGEKRCHNGCIPETGICCAGSGYCRAGYVCTSNNRCSPSGSSGGGGGGSGGGGSTCDAGKTRCDTNFCMPTGSVCCGDGRGGYCPSNYSCTANDKCCPIGQTCSGSGGGSGGGGSGSGGGGITLTSSTPRATIDIPSPTLEPPPSPTNIDDSLPIDETTTSSTSSTSTTSRANAFTAPLPTSPATTPLPGGASSANGISASVKGCILAVGGAALLLLF